MEKGIHAAVKQLAHELTHRDTSSKPPTAKQLAAREAARARMMAINEKRWGSRSGSRAPPPSFASRVPSPPSFAAAPQRPKKAAHVEDDDILFRPSHWVNYDSDDNIESDDDDDDHVPLSVLARRPYKAPVASDDDEEMEADLDDLSYRPMPKPTRKEAYQRNVTFANPLEREPPKKKKVSVSTLTPQKATTTRKKKEKHAAVQTLHQSPRRSTRLSGRR